MTVRALGALLRSGKASSLELVQDALAKAKDDRYQSFIRVSADQELEQAAERDKELAAEMDRGPFHGIPIGYKDISIQGNQDYRRISYLQGLPTGPRRNRCRAAPSGRRNQHRKAKRCTNSPMEQLRKTLTTDSY